MLLMDTTLQVGDIMKLLKTPSRVRIQQLVELGFLTPLKDCTGVGDFRQYSPTNAVMFVVASELIRGGVHRRKLKALFAESNESWFDPYGDQRSENPVTLAITGDGKEWTFRISNGTSRRKLVIDLMSIKNDVRSYVEHETHVKLRSY